jgi:hypothetical protein
MVSGTTVTRRVNMTAREGSHQYGNTTGTIYIVTYRPIARQRLGEHIPTEAYARNIERPLLVNRSVNKPSQQ